MPTAPSALPAPSRWNAFRDGFMRAFHAYGAWLVRISWGRFLLLSLLLILIAAMLENLLTWKVQQTTTTARRPAVSIHTAPPAVPQTPARPPAATLPQATPDTPAPPAPPQAAASGSTSGPTSAKETDGRGVLTVGGQRYEIDLSSGRLRITPRAAAGASAASAPASVIDINLHSGQAATDVDQAKREIEGAIEDLRAKREARGASEPADWEGRMEQRIEDKVEKALEQALEKLDDESVETVTRFGPGKAMPELAMLWIFASALLKFTYKQQQQAETTAARAVETAEAEALKRQVAEARMAAMQAQIEPHFLFNTLGSIDHLIETDPKRASQMQKHLIALLRASMPSLREAAGEPAGRSLGRELAVIQPYLELLKMRMEERLATRIDVPAGLLSADFPPMMLQTLVENAIKHGLEPKPEGGALDVKAEVVDGQLAVSVTDTGLGFGQGGASTAGDGVGLANIRERLALRHGARAALVIEQPAAGGSRVTIRVPYQPVAMQAAAGTASAAA